MYCMLMMVLEVCNFFKSYQWKKLNSLRSVFRRQSLTQSTKTTKIKEVDISFAAHCHNVKVLLSNISFLIFAVSVLQVNDCHPCIPF